MGVIAGTSVGQNSSADMEKVLNNKAIGALYSLPSKMWLESVYVAGKGAADSWAYLAFEGPYVASSMVAGVGELKVGKDILLGVARNYVENPEGVCDNLSDALMKKGMESYRLNYARYKEYKKTESMSQDDFEKFLKDNHNVNYLGLGKDLYTNIKLYNSRQGKYSVEKEFKVSWKGAQFLLEEIDKVKNSTESPSTFGTVKDIVGIAQGRLVEYPPYRDFLVSVKQLESKMDTEFPMAKMEEEVVEEKVVEVKPVEKRDDTAVFAKKILKALKSGDSEFFLSNQMAREDIPFLVKHPCAQERIQKYGEEKFIRSLDNLFGVPQSRLLGNLQEAIETNRDYLAQQNLSMASCNFLSYEYFEKDTLLYIFVEAVDEGKNESHRLLLPSLSIKLNNRWKFVGVFGRFEMADLPKEQVVVSSEPPVINENETKIAETRKTLGMLVSAMDQFKADKGGYPTLEEGFNALIRPSGKNYIGSPTLPKDAWGRDFFYALNSKNNTYSVNSYGADGKFGGEGYDADIKEYLKQQTLEDKKVEKPVATEVVKSPVVRIGDMDEFARKVFEAVKAEDSGFFFGLLVTREDMPSLKKHPFIMKLIERKGEQKFLESFDEMAAEIASGELLSDIKGDFERNKAFLNGLGLSLESGKFVSCVYSEKALLRIFVAFNSPSGGKAQKLMFCVPCIKADSSWKILEWFSPFEIAEEIESK